MTDEKDLSGEFSLDFICHLEDELLGSTWALRALGELLRTSNLQDFGIHKDSEDLGWGLDKLLNYAIDAQTATVKKFCQRYKYSDFYCEASV